jgi:hypothetical protein
MQYVCNNCQSLPCTDSLTHTISSSLRARIISRTAPLPPGSEQRKTNCAASVMKICRPLESAWDIFSHCNNCVLFACTTPYSPRHAVSGSRPITQMPKIRETFQTHTPIVLCDLRALRCDSGHYAETNCRNFESKLTERRTHCDLH